MVSARIGTVAERVLLAVAQLASLALDAVDVVAALIEAAAGAWRVGGREYEEVTCG